MSEGDLKYVAKEDNFNEEQAYEHWKIIFNEYLEAFGLPESYQRYLEYMAKAAKLYNESYNKGKRYKLINARIAEAEADRQLSSEGESLAKTAARLSKYVGYPIDIKKTSVSQYYSFIELIQDGQ